MKKRIKESLKRLVIISVTVSMFIQSWGISVYADNIKDNVITKEQNNVSGSDISDTYSIENHTATESEIQMEATDSFGELFVKSLESETNREDTGYSIFSISIENKEARVNYYAVDEACIVVGIFTEDGSKLLATGSGIITSDVENAQIPIAIEQMPEYFYVKGYIVDKDTLQPLCTEYSTPNYTKEMQEFLNKTISDFQDDRVYNLDEDITTNFAIYKEEIIVKEQTAGTNTVTYEDNEKKKYVIENADEEVKNLEEGDIYAYERSDGILIVKVSSVEKENTAVTLYGTEINIEDVFDYIKIETTAGMDEASLEPEENTKAVLYQEEENNDACNNINISENALPYSISENNLSNDTIMTTAFEGEIGGGSEKFEFDILEEDVLSAKIGIEVGVSLKYYLSFSYRSIDLCFNVGASIKAEFSTNLDGFKKKLPRPIKLRTVSGVNVVLDVYFKVDADVALSVEGNIESKFGISYNSDTGIKDIKKITTDFNVQIEGKFQIGLEFDPRVELLSESIGTIGGAIDALVEITGKKNLFKDETDADELHRCTLCFDGNINAVFSFNLKGKIFNTEKLGFEYKLAKLSFKIADWYFSNDLKKFGFGICPNRSMRVTVTVKDINGRIVNDANVNAWKTSDKSQEVKTIFSKTEKGKTSAFLEKGSYYIEISCAGYENKKEKIKIDKKPRNIVIYFDKVNNVTFDPGIYDNSQNDYSLNEIQVNEINQKFNGNIKQIEMTDSGYSVAVVTKNNELFIADRRIFKNNGELGISLFHKVMDNVDQVVMGDYGRNNCVKYAAILTDGTLYVWSTYFDYDLKEDIINPPQKILSNVQEVAIGAEHYIALTKNGEVYTWGDNSVGQLGINIRGGYYSVPQKVMKNARSVSAMRDTSFVITSNYDLYISGDRSNLYEYDDRYIWEGDTGYSSSKKFTLYKQGIKKCIGDSSYIELALISTDNKLYAVGFARNIYETFEGYEDYRGVSEYEMQYLMDNVIDVDFSCGNIAALNAARELYIWGDINKSGRPQKVLDHISSFCLSRSSVAMLNEKSVAYFINSTTGFGDFFQMASDCKDIYLQMWGEAWGYIDLNGDVYMMGRNINTSGGNILGNGTTGDSDDYVCVMHNGNRFVNFNSSEIGVLTTNNELYVWGVIDGKDILKPRKVGEHILDVKNGYLINSKNELWSFSYKWDDDLLSMNTKLRIDEQVKEYIGRYYIGAYSGADYYIKTNGDFVSKQEYKKPQIVAHNVKKAYCNDSIIGYLTKNGDLYIAKNRGNFEYICSDVSDFSFSGQSYVDIDSEYTREAAYAIVKTDGSLWAWGNDSNGTFAYNPYINGSYVKYYKEPVQINNHVKKVFFDTEHSVLGFINDSNEAYVHGLQQASIPKLSYKHPSKVNESYYLSIFNEIEPIGCTKNRSADTKEPLLKETTDTVTSSSVSAMTGNEVFYNLIPNMVYNYYLVKDKETEDILSEENLLYIGQGISDPNGEIHFSYQTEKTFSEAESFIIPMFCDEVTDVIGTLDISKNASEEQVTLKFGTDADLSLVEFSVKLNNSDGKTVWITAKKDKNGNYTASMPMSIFNYNKGIYDVNVLAEDYFRNSRIVASGQFKIEKKYCGIKYVLNDDNFTPATNSLNNPSKFLVGGSVIKLLDATRSGYKFMGWYSDAGLSNQIEEIPTNIEEEIIIYAKWQKLSENNGTNDSNNSNNSTNSKISSLTITGISKKIAAGKSIQLTAEISPAGAANKGVTWSSGNSKFATVNASGKVTVKKAGIEKSVIITAKANDGSGVSATYKIQIMKDAVKSVKLSVANKTVKAGKKIKVKATVKTTGKKANKTLKWTSSNTAYATVNKSGKVTTKKAGKGKTVTITAQATDGSGKKAKIKIKIK